MTYMVENNEAGAELYTTVRDLVTEYIKNNNAEGMAPLQASALLIQLAGRAAAVGEVAMGSTPDETFAAAQMNFEAGYNEAMKDIVASIKGMRN